MKIRRKNDHAIESNVDTDLTTWDGGNYYVGHTDLLSVILFPVREWEPVPEKRWEPVCFQMAQSGRYLYADGMPEIHLASDCRVILRDGGATIMIERKAQK